MYVCVCNSVTDNDIRQAVEAGVCTMDGLSSKLGVSDCCGRCEECARKVLFQSVASRVTCELIYGQ